MERDIYIQTEIESEGDKQINVLSHQGTRIAKSNHAVKQIKYQRTCGQTTNLGINGLDVQSGNGTSSDYGRISTNGLFAHKDSHHCADSAFMQWVGEWQQI